MGNNSSTTPKQRLVEIGPGFWNCRASFPFLKGLVDIGTHMSFIKLSNGKILVIDTVPLDDNLKAEIDALTDNGKNIEAVLATHPFHTLAFNGFYAAYPNTEYYGAPRHLRRLTDIPWAGRIDDPKILSKWAPDVEMRIPAGAEFDNPLPESYNHFVCVWVYHPASKTIHVDDTINYFGNPSVLMRIAGKSKGLMQFHDSMRGPGLHPTTSAPVEFKEWVKSILEEWEFDNMCCAHIENKIGNAKQSLAQCLDDAEPIFEKLIRTNKQIEEEEKKSERSKSEEDSADEQHMKECAKYNVEGNECG
eukprot:TRINITY_DN1002_c0_g1_i1.p1 TRINITY_DN1002_c0_g1~~TRINITY_DN1002_c0_g1_i1.p1  ORF type:complete len:305 (-),score=63.32 TRINITY_DN1002_c0_g1_i1:88-1002(-)